MSDRGGQAREQMRKSRFINISSGPCSLQPALLMCQWTPSRVPDEAVRVWPCVHLCVCVCARMWLSLVCSPLAGMTRSCQGKAVVRLQIWQGAGRVDSSRWGKAPHPSNPAAGGCLSAAYPPALGPADFNYSLPGRTHRWLPWEEAFTSPQTPGCSFPQWISRATMKQKLVASPFFTQPGVRGWPFTPGDSKD